MSEPRTETTPATGSVNGTTLAELEARLRHFFGEQRRLRELLDQMQAKARLLTLKEADEQRLTELAETTRVELERINAELFRFQDRYCTDVARQEEYDKVMERILGFDPRIDLNEVAEVLAGKSSCEMKDFIVQLERTLKATSAHTSR